MRESAITRLGDRTLSHFFYYRKLQFFLKLCNFFGVIKVLEGLPLKPAPQKDIPSKTLTAFSYFLEC
ncbi:hypothetical protein LIP72_16010, partial [Mediterraneibacter faecis]|uniref:hypothetical protein n=1 Tax=Mediterraneibacter faecis TaxID=592978 RepID=UPI001D0155AB